MKEKLIINTNLLRKESEFRTKSCILEKAVAVSHSEFENLKRHPLRDNRLIAENVDMMYCDRDDKYHCLLIYDEEQGNGLLIESEGADYARYAQYIPKAEKLVEKHLQLDINSVLLNIETSKEPLFTGIVNTEKDPLNVRKSPSTEAEIIGRLDKGSTVTVYSETDGWCEIEYNGGIGYVSKEYISCSIGGFAKPVIYLYPEKKQDISVKVKFKDGNFTCTYPEYNNGWNVTAYPDGKIINKADNDEYSYLYWEGEGKIDYDFSSGFVVKKEDTVKFLKEKLSYMGLTPKEYNEFIVYWLPIMQKNEYNLISFQTDNYEESAKLEISPKPDSMLRVFMAFKEVTSDTIINEQKIEPFKRNGFTVIEWGGTEVN